LFLFTIQLSAQDLPPKIGVVANETVTVTGNLQDGSTMTDLSWAWNSSVACFPETQRQKFTGQHVLYYVDVPRYSELTITVVPTDKTQDFSLYAYEVGQVNKRNLVPNLAHCVRCEADHRWDRPRRGKTQDHIRTVRDILAINNPYQAVIGVVGPPAATEGDFELRIEMKGR
ncbi:MAG: hypothetical protein AAGJ82_15135, partial [Bacteroidota bacterium]